MSSQPSAPTDAPLSDPGEPYTPEVEDPAPVDESPDPRTVFDNRVNVPTGTAHVFSGRQWIYNSPGDEGMLAVINRYLQSVEWIQLISWNNTSDATMTYQYSYSTGLKVTVGSEVSVGVNVGASYEGMSMSVDASARTFTSTETTSTKTTTLTVNVAPHSQVVFYQKRYNFRDEIGFINDAWGQLWNIGPWGGYNPLTTKVTSVSIMADEYFTAIATLPEGPGKVTTSTVATSSYAGTTRKRENVTERAKDMLVRMGL